MKQDVHWSERLGQIDQRNELARQLAVKLDNKKAIVGIIGLGYVGLPLAVAIAKAGLTVIGFDVDSAKASSLNAGRSYIKHIIGEQLQTLKRSDLFTATDDFASLTRTDCIVICVPTPLTHHLEPDLRFVASSCETIAEHLRRGQLVVLESSTYPGTTAEVVRPILERDGLKSGKDFFLAYAPEREDPGNPHFSTSQIPKVVGGDGLAARDLAVRLYGSFCISTVPVSSTATAEAVKITENVFRAVNIALANELKVIYKAMGVDIWEVIDAAKTKPFGYMPFYPGPGLGGHCIPIDPFYLTWKAREFGISTRFIELAGQINTAMPEYVIGELARALDLMARKGLNGTSVLVLGLAYKKNVDDSRESPSLRLMELIEARGGKASYYDPHIPTIPDTREHKTLNGRRSIAWYPEVPAQFDAVLIATDHDDVDYKLVVKHAKLVVDTRNACARAGVRASHVFVC
jgi:UDP-N-acetyl-D-glucosamine dehydrogenase